MAFDLNFNNPVEIGNKEEGGLFDAPVETIEIEQETSETTEVEEQVEEQEVKETPEEVVEQQEQPKEVEEAEEVEEVESFFTEDNAPVLLNALSEIGFLGDSLPEGIDPDNISIEDTKKILEYRDNVIKTQVAQEASTAAQEQIVGKLNPLVQQIMYYNLKNPNMEAKDISQFVGSLGVANSFSSLTPEKDAEKIVKEYYKAKNETPDEIAERVSDLVQLDKLTKEATKLKPKLDAIAQEQVNAQIQQANSIKEANEAMQTSLREKTITKLNTAELEGVELNREDQSYLYSVIMNNEVPVNLGGKKVEMGHLEAMIMKEKYEGNIDRVMLAALVLRDGGEGIKKYFGQSAKNAEIDKFVKQVKFSNKKKTGVKSGSTKPADAGFTLKFN